MSITSTLTVTNVWQPIFGVPSTGYCQVQIIENFVGGRRANFTLNRYSDASGNPITELIDCRGFASFGGILPSKFSLDGTIQYWLRNNAGNLETMVDSGSYNLTFVSISASQTNLQCPQGPQGDQGAQGAQGLIGFQGSQGPPGVPIDTSFISMSSRTAVGTGTVFLLPAGSAATYRASRYYVRVATILSLSAVLSVAPGLGQSRTILISNGGSDTPTDTAASLTISDLNTTGQWTGAVSTIFGISIRCTATATAANSVIMASVHFTPQFIQL